MKKSECPPTISPLPAETGQCSEECSSIQAVLCILTNVNRIANQMHQSMTQSQWTLGSRTKGQRQHIISQMSDLSLNNHEWTYISSLIFLKQYSMLVCILQGAIKH